MSAYICSEKTFNRIRTYIDTNFNDLARVFADHWETDSTDYMSHITKIKEQKELILTWLIGGLIIQNHKSVSARYNKNEDGRDYLVAYKPKREHIDALQFIKSIDCLEYQCCETKSWNKSKFKKICDQLQLAVLSKLNGYDERDWG